jgi:Fic family protein
MLRETFPSKTDMQAANELLFAEARHSAAIEGEHRTEAVLLHHEALLEYVQAPVSQAALLDMHRAMMNGQHHAQPGRYRTVRVTVGRHRPPAPALLPALMDELFAYAAATGLNPVAQAAWAHLQFETIHPFADGNGRTGRALINRLLEAPLPLSEYILNHRQEYYRLLGAGDWRPYLDWFVTGVMEETLLYRKPAHSQQKKGKTERLEWPSESPG